MPRSDMWSVTSTSRAAPVWLRREMIEGTTPLDRRRLRREDRSLRPTRSQDRHLTNSPTSGILIKHASLSAALKVQAGSYEKVSIQEDTQQLGSS